MQQVQQMGESFRSDNMSSITGGGGVNPMLAGGSFNMGSKRVSEDSGEEDVSLIQKKMKGDQFKSMLNKLGSGGGGTSSGPGGPVSVSDKRKII